MLKLVSIQAPTNQPTRNPTDQPTTDPTQLPKPGDDVPVTDAPTPAVVTTSSPTTSGIPGDEDVPVTGAPTPVPTNTVR